MALAISHTHRVQTGGGEKSVEIIAAMAERGMHKNSSGK